MGTLVQIRRGVGLNDLTYQEITALYKLNTGKPFIGKKKDQLVKELKKVKKLEYPKYDTPKPKKKKVKMTTKLEREIAKARLNRKAANQPQAVPLEDLIRVRDENGAWKSVKKGSLTQATIAQHIDKMKSLLNEHMTRKHSFATDCFKQIRTNLINDIKILKGLLA